MRDELLVIYCPQVGGYLGTCAPVALKAINEHRPFYFSTDVCLNCAFQFQDEEEAEVHLNSLGDMDIEYEFRFYQGALALEDQECAKNKEGGGDD